MLKAFFLAVILADVACWLEGGSAYAQDGQTVIYRCLDDTTFTLRASQDFAIVQFANGEYKLPRRPSDIALKYASDQATLYLDGDFAAFVADDRPLPGCVRSKRAERG
jgi:hypothetical protein